MGKSFKEEIESLKTYFKEDASKVVVNPRFKKEFFEETKYAILEEKEQAEFKPDPYILGRAKVKLTILNKPTQNLTYYDNAWCQEAILENQAFQDKLLKKRVFGELDHPKNPDGSLKDISHAVLKVWLDADDLWGIVEIFNTPAGQVLWTLLNAGVILGVSSRGLGDDYFEGGVKKVSGKNFEMIGWDFVANPSNVGSEFVEFAESKQRNIVAKLENLNRGTKHSIAGEILNSFAEEKKVKEENIKLKKTIEELEEKLKLESAKYSEFETKNKELNLKLENTNLEMNKIAEAMKVQIESVKSYEKSIEAERKEKKTLLEQVGVLNSELKDKELLISKTKIEMEELKRDGSKRTTTYNIQIEDNNRVEEDKKKGNLYKGRMPQFK